MKELETHLKAKERVEINAQQQKEKQTILIGKIKPKSGHILWQINTKTLEVKPAEYKIRNVDYSKAEKGDFSKLKDLIIEQLCIYIPALNKQNALKKYYKNNSQDHYYTKEPLWDIKDITF